jgi:tartronate-semialdehyde synthase
VPVIPTLMGWGTIPDDHPLMAGMCGLQTSHRYGNATLLASRLRAGHRQPLGKSPHRVARGLLQGPQVRARGHRADADRPRLRARLGIVSDAKAALELFVEVAREWRAAGKLRDFSAWVKECQGARLLEYLRKTNFDDVPMKPQRVYQCMNNAFGKTRDLCLDHRPEPDRRRAVPARLRPAPVDQLRPGRSAGLDGAGRARRARADPKAKLVALSGDYDFQFMIEELAVGAQFKLPYIHIVVNNSYLGLIRQSQRGFSMDYCVQLAFDNINTPSAEPSAGYGVDHVKVVEGLGCKAIRVHKQEEIAPAVKQAEAWMEEYKVPVVIEVILERVTNIAMGTEIDNVVEFEELAAGAADVPTAIAMLD